MWFDSGIGRLGLATWWVLSACSPFDIQERIVELVGHGPDGEPAPNYLPPKPQAAGTRVAEVDVAHEPPFVGDSGVDEFGYPLRHPDKIALLNLLRLKRFEELDRFMTFYQDEFEADFRKEYWPEDSLDAFSNVDPAIGPLLDTWVERSPNSFAAWAARGRHRFALGWHYRGHEFSGQTSRAQFGALASHHERAAQDLARALELRPRAIAVHGVLLQLAKAGRAASPRLQLDQALRVCPSCYVVRAHYMEALTPRWGGSHAQMQAFAKDAEGASNPRLRWLAGFVDWDRARSMRERGKNYVELLALAGRAVDAGPELQFVQEQAWLLQMVGRLDDAQMTLDRAIRLYPQDIRTRGLRYSLRNDKGDWLGAARDLVVVRALDPTNPDRAKNAAWLVDMLRHQGDNLYKAKQHQQAAEYFTAALQLAPDDHDLMVRQGWNQKLLEGDAADAPAEADDFTALLRKDHGLAVQGRFEEVISMWDGFIAKHPDDPRAYRERGGAKWHRRDPDGAVADMQRACDLGMGKACEDVPRMKARLGN